MNTLILIAVIGAWGSVIWAQVRRSASTCVRLLITTKALMESETMVLGMADGWQAAMMTRGYTGRFLEPAAQSAH